VAATPLPSGQRVPTDPSGAGRAGTVEVSVRLRAGPSEVWAALTDPAQFGQWFGDLAGPLAPDRATSIAFGDGDMFAVENVQLDRPSRIAYDWRFQGIGPLDRIAWQIIPRADGCRLVVTDREPERSPEGVHRMRTGWLDFLGRLQRFVLTGERARYDWSREIEAGIECDVDLVTAWRRLVQPPALPAWLAGLAPARTDGGPGFVSEATWAPFQVTLQVAEPGWDAPTRCRVMAEERRSGTLLTVVHAGWGAVSADLDVAREHRRRYCARWIAALQDARRVAGIGEDGTMP
jgi:uncharacterized protein YndB with AHSA1/START domain